MSYLKILDYGTFYYPAWKHYGHSTTEVVCDRCLKHNLSACIGYNDQDLCLKCADELSNPNIKYYHEQYIAPVQIPIQVPVPVPIRVPIYKPPCNTPQCDPCYEHNLQCDIQCDSQCNP